MATSNAATMGIANMRGVPNTVLNTSLNTVVGSIVGGVGGVGSCGNCGSWDNHNVVVDVESDTANEPSNNAFKVVSQRRTIGLLCMSFMLYHCRYEFWLVIPAVCGCDGTYELC